MIKLGLGDEIDALGDNFMFIVWTSDTSPFLTNSNASRFPICVLPSSRYAVDPDTGVNITLEAITLQVTQSFNALSTAGVKIRGLEPSRRNQPVPMITTSESFPNFFEF